MEDLTKKGEVEDIIIKSGSAETMERLVEMIKEDLSKADNKDIILNVGGVRIVKAEGEKEIKVLREPERNREREVRNEFLYLTAGKNKNWGKATELLISWILENNCIYTTRDDNKTEMWIYRGGIYIPQGKSIVKESLRKLLGSFYSQYIYGLVINKLEPDTFIDVNKFFNQNNVYEIPVQNGILNIITKELIPFTPKKIFFNKINALYIPEADCPMIDKFLSEVLTIGDDKKVFYEIGGFCLLKEYKFEKAFIFVGDGRNGKDKSLELLKRLFGVENCCSVPLSSLTADSFVISEFFGKMINIAGEVNNQDLKDTSMFKALTGRSLVSAQRKFLNAVTFQNFAKFIFACNELPMVYDNSKGFWDRWVLLNFPYTFVTCEEIDKQKCNDKLKLRDEDIIEKITTPEEMSGLLNKFLEGLDRILMNRHFSSTIGSEEIKTQWIRKANSFMAFCMDNIEESYDSYITKKELRKKYLDYYKKYRLKGSSEKAIKAILEEMFGVCEDKLYKPDDFGGNQQIYVWSGIKWKK